MRMFGFPTYLFYIFMISCASQKSMTKTTVSQTSKYSEDLTPLRPRAMELPARDTSAVKQNDNGRRSTAYVEPKIAINQKLEWVLDSIDRINLNQRYVEGFTIQIYSGAKREEALNIRKQLSNWVPGLDSEVQYVQPNFRVKAGRYLQRLEAQKDYIAVKQHFPNAIVTPDRIAIN